MMSKCTENSNKEEYDSRDITMSKGGKNNEFILIEEKVEFKKFFYHNKVNWSILSFCAREWGSFLGSRGSDPKSADQAVKVIADI